MAAAQAGAEPQVLWADLNMAQLGGGRLLPIQRNAQPELPLRKLGRHLDAANRAASVLGRMPWDVGACQGQGCCPMPSVRLPKATPASASRPTSVGSWCYPGSTGGLGTRGPVNAAASNVFNAATTAARKGGCELAANSSAVITASLKTMAMAFASAGLPQLIRPRRAGPSRAAVVSVSFLSSVRRSGLDRRPAQIATAGFASNKTEATSSTSPTTTPSRGRGGAAARAGSGTITSRHETEMGFQAGGRIATRIRNVGDVVQQGDVLATLDPTQERLCSTSVEAALVRTQARAANTAAAEKQTRYLERRGVAPRAQLDDALAGRDTAAADVRQAQADLVRPATTRVTPRSAPAWTAWSRPGAPKTARSWLRGRRS